MVLTVLPWNSFFNILMTFYLIFLCSLIDVLVIYPILNWFDFLGKWIHNNSPFHVAQWQKILMFIKEAFQRNSCIDIPFGNIWKCCFICLILKYKLDNFDLKMHLLQYFHRGWVKKTIPMYLLSKVLMIVVLVSTDVSVSVLELKCLATSFSNVFHEMLIFHCYIYQLRL